MQVSFDSNYIPKILRQLERLQETIRLRREKQRAYIDRLHDLSKIKILPLDLNGVPWRFLFRIPGIDRKMQESISHHLRREGIDVSNWYVPTHWMLKTGFRTIGKLTGTEILSNTIYQFWVTKNMTTRKIDHACHVLRHINQSRFQFLHCNY